MSYSSPSPREQRLSALGSRLSADDLRMPQCAGASRGRRREPRAESRAPLASAAVALLCGLALLAPSARAGAQQEQEQQLGAIGGVVQDSTGNPLAGVEVTVLRDDGPRTFTDDDGEFLLRRIPLGDVKLQVRRLGYRAQEVKTFVGRANATSSITVVLAAVPQEMEAVTVKGKRLHFSGPLADFYRRRESRNGGHFFTRDQIDSIRPARTTDLLRRVPSLRFQPFGYYGNTAVRGRDQRCGTPLIWVDGTPLMNNYYDLDQINPRTIEGIEVYGGPASVPQALVGPMMNSACGVIAVWTRVGDRAPRRASAEERAEAAAALAALVDSSHVYTEQQVDQAAQLAPQTRFAPEYPPELKRTNTTGAVVVEFVVDATGHVEPKTLGVVYSPHPLFTASVNAALETALFTPAVRHGHAVRQLVQLPVHFVNPEGKREQ